MNYTYTIYSDNGNEEHPIRCDMTTKIEELKLTDFVWPRYVEVYDNLKNEVKRTLKSIDDFEDWITTQERVAAWKPDIAEAFSIKNESWDPFSNKETDIMMKDKEEPVVNIKTLAGLNKPKTSTVPPIAFFALGIAMKDGADKYGRFNWRTTEVTASVFYDAMMRHLLYWYYGEDHAKDSKVHHLAHLMAGAAIILDAEQKGVFIDDRDTNSKPFNIEEMLKILKGE